MENYFLSENGFGIRLIDSQDSEWLIKLRNDVDVWNNLGTIRPLNQQLEDEWISSLNHKSDREYFIFGKEGERIGLIRCTEIDYINRSACVGLDIENQHRGSGLSYLAYNLILKYFFDKMNFNRLYLYVLSTNLRAIHIYDKIGFKKEGVAREAIIRDGMKIDYILMGFLRSEYEPKK